VGVGVGADVEMVLVREEELGRLNKVGSEMTLMVLKDGKNGLNALERALRERIFLMEGVVGVWFSVGFGSDERGSRQGGLW
jgi:hypothetical protein